MKIRIPLIVVAAFFTLSCEKKEEKPSPVVRAQSAENKTRPPVAPVTPAPSESLTALQEIPAPASPPTPEEVQAFITDITKLAQDVGQIPKDATPGPEVDALQKTYSALIQRRGALMAGMNEEQKKKFQSDIGPLVKNISPTLVRLRLAKAREQMKNLPPPPPGTPQAPTLEELIPGSTAPPPQGQQPAPPPPTPPQ